MRWFARPGIAAAWWARLPERRGEEGFAAVDALVGLTILALTLSLALQALGSSRNLAATALETQQATRLLQYLVDSSPNRIGALTGVTGGFGWRLQVAMEPADLQAANLRLCRWSAEAVNAKSRRRYDLDTLEFCRAPDAAS